MSNTSSSGDQISPIAKNSPPEGWWQCSSNEDCTTILGFCAWEPVNKAHAEELHQFIVKKYNLDVKLYKCPQEFEDSPQPQAICVNQRCVIQ